MHDFSISHLMDFIQMLPGNFTNQVVQKDWFPILDAAGIPVGMGEGTAALQILLSIDPSLPHPNSDPGGCDK